METKMTTKPNFNNRADRGFSLIEMMVVVAIITLVLAGILSQIDQAQQRATAEQGKVDDFQQARDFLDQIFRDARQMGYPNVRDFDTSNTASWPLGLPLAYNTNVAVGLVRLSPTQLEFQGDVDGTGVVSVVSYAINGNGACTTCIQRAQVAKLLGDPVAQAIPATAYAVEVQNVQNPTAIFSAFDFNGNAINIAGGINMDVNPIQIAEVRSIQIQLSIASPTSVDPKTGQQLEADIGGRVQVINCSMATTHAALAAAGVNPPGEIQLACQ
jgi:prepilin-type N-terminal cleavage/methylation domain-containing protein